VQSIDLAPTLLDIAGLKPLPGMQGRSLVPVLAGMARGWRSSVLIEYFTDTVFPRVRNMGYVAVRTDRHKYIHYRELAGMDELYDLVSDPYEQRNLAGDASARPVLERMQQELQRQLTETKFPWPTSISR
jgi:N-acetylglucosamine-6-sulfatase